MMGSARRRVAIAGTAGLPASYGGFETLVENLVRFHDTGSLGYDLTVYCTSVERDTLPPTHGSAKLAYIKLEANGMQSIPYDCLSILHAVRTGHDTLLLLGVSGAVCLPLVRMFTRLRIITNVDGVEWRREKWSPLARFVLRVSEWLAVRCSHMVIADNAGIAEHLAATYKAASAVIPYGGDHALLPDGEPESPNPYGSGYALALCRIEPENNIHMILEAWEHVTTPLVFVGNWAKSTYGRELAQRYRGRDNIQLVDPVYEPRTLRQIRGDAAMYVHGHSAGGTNPSLVEMMHFGIPVLAHGCNFNRHTTDNKAIYFTSAGELANAVNALDSDRAQSVGQDMKSLAGALYTWDAVGQRYFDLLGT